MERRIPWLWIGVAAALLLVPTSAGRLLLDVIGGLTLTLLLLPLLAGGVALIGWQLLRRRLRTCPSCGFASLGTDVCPACGSLFTSSDAPGSTPSEPPGSIFWGTPSGGEIDARDVTINVDAVDVEASASGETGGRGGDGS
ncbi:FYDLN acid domain-containing protein [Synechococcus sp. CCAP 1479/9]|uniref:FYDLN acid domain-containing protein n=1 Tax=Synechococcus sp. CCAP 1479/9 TaxID=1221593 RepID=UPI001C21FB1E|nr:FYDLN acid domain-containing protein [Synechococcus sp. CCAP 1479/9]